VRGAAKGEPSQMNPKIGVAEHGMYAEQSWCLCRLDPSVVYDGPHAEFATLGGSPTWGLGEHFAEFAAARGYTRLGLFRPLTPYGTGPQVEHYRGPRGRPFLRIPSYGQVVDEDPQLRASEWKTFWILWKAGVRVLLVGGTSGSCDWRRSLADEDAVRPGDLVLPKSYLTRDTMPMGLPGTELEFCLTRQVAIMDDPFCPPLAETLRALAPPHTFRRLHGPEANVVLNRWLAGNGFESLATCRMLEVLGRQTGMPVITGDCVSPVLARVCGMHLAYYHVVANWGTGLEPEDPTISLNRLYMETLPAIAATLELTFLDTAPEPTTCRCRELLKARPTPYERALSPRLP
jgi:purine nucleoside phosphorylase